LKDFQMFIERIHKISQNKWREIFTNLRKYYRIHEVNWSETEVKDGFACIFRSAMTSNSGEV